ncbi:helix-turn-helix domain-containing protein [Nesterenkonia halotolerans]|uniref:DNA-binding transcriptional MerR regulator n=1 Tax=Nesterenkonia halotolerans TaxID=225325 RepID=A0ABR9J691_9MICC|nr:MerR family transcriptional regulator [Nesterenkonia halotolerans]MBE1514516.1 DNA-binding transcriptional MerR regulator [Nesterenkonia halotolerans]
MLSSEIADLAGVTVRTLRHYHHIGVLPEPSRSSAGYRRYDISHLIQLLRIRRLTALGVPLSELSRVLEAPFAAEDLLEELDLQAAAEVDRPNARRARIAELRRSGAPADLAPELAAWRSAPEALLSAEMSRVEHEQLVLLGHLLGDGGHETFSAGFAALNTQLIAPLTARFAALDGDTPAAEIEGLIHELISVLRPVDMKFADLPPLDDQVIALMDELTEQRLHPVQKQVLRQIQREMEELEDG